MACAEKGYSFTVTGLGTDVGACKIFARRTIDVVTTKLRAIIGTDGVVLCGSCGKDMEATIGRGWYTREWALFIGAEGPETERGVEQCFLRLPPGYTREYDPSVGMKVWTKKPFQPAPSSRIFWAPRVDHPGDVPSMKIALRASLLTAQRSAASAAGGRRPFLLS